MSIFHTLTGLVLYLLFQIASSSSHASNTLVPSESLRPSSNRTLASPGDVFELGFFSSGNRWYIGIWYKKVSVRTYVWVANRDNPLLDYNGTFGISATNLVIRDQVNRLVWSTELRIQRSQVAAELLDDGDFVLRSYDLDEDEFLWRSFDFPTDTLIPQMQLGLDPKNSKTKRFLTSWKIKDDDPSSGDFTFRLQTQGSPELFGTYKGTRVFDSGPWEDDTKKFKKLPPLFNLTWTRVDATCSFIATNNSYLSRLVMAHSGLLIQFTWNQTTTKWDWLWNLPNDICDVYNLCGSNGYCNSNTSEQHCTCIEGFEPRDPTYVANGCIRKKPLKCGADKFIILTEMSFPNRDTASTIPVETNQIQECQNICVANCNCTAFAVTNTLQRGISNCVTWRGELSTLRRNANESLNLYVKINGEKKRNKKGKIIGLGVGIPTVIIILFSLAGFCYWKRKQNLATAVVEVVLMPTDTDMYGADTIENQQMDFGIILRATDNFSDSNEIGHGGFGKVYKGQLNNGEEIAVKKLDESSTQGLSEFKNEVSVIARLQHVNLVCLRGWSTYNEEKVLIYEYLENGSLEGHLFGGRNQTSRLNWQTRFEIIDGIARGLEYMQEESRVKIVHRDLKPGNILLDIDMVPKISDFGLARICRKNENEALTTAVAGSYGYMSPEYAGKGIYSTKSDVYSFGVIVLEIVTGKKNRTFSLSDPNCANLLSYVWINWMNGSWEKIVDEIMLHDASQSGQILRCIEIGLLCVQQLAEDRPKMSSVVMMLGNETCPIPKPKPPGFFIGNGPSSTGEPSSVNQYTVTDIPPR